MDLYEPRSPFFDYSNVDPPDEEEPQMRIRMYCIQGPSSLDAGLAAAAIVSEVNKVIAAKDADDVKRVETQKASIPGSGDEKEYFFIAFLWIQEEEDEYVGKQYSHPHRYTEYGNAD